MPTFYDPPRKRKKGLVDSQAHDPQAWKTDPVPPPTPESRGRSLGEAGHVYGPTRKIKRA
jgi:hypothetical protein